jgi:hypothetical protein
VLTTLCSLRLLALCCVNNVRASELCAQVKELSLDNCIANYLEAGFPAQEGARAPSDHSGESLPAVDPDVIYYIQRPYVRLITHVHLKSENAVSVSSHPRWWPGSAQISDEPEPLGSPQATHGDTDDEARHSVMGEFVAALKALEARLRAVERVPNTLEKFQDAGGCDLSLHVGAAEQILETLASFFSVMAGSDMEDLTAAHEHTTVVKSLLAVLPALSRECCRFRLSGCVEQLQHLQRSLKLVTKGLRLDDVSIASELAEEDEDDGHDAHSDEKRFLSLFADFKRLLSLYASDDYLR